MSRPNVYTDIESNKTQIAEVKTKADNSVQLTTDQTISDNKSFNNTIQGTANKALYSDTKPITDNSTAIATTAFVQAIKANIQSAMATDSTTSSTALSSHITDTSNPHGVTKAQVGLGNIPNSVSDSTSSNSSTSLATSKAVYAVQQIATAANAAAASVATDLANLTTTVSSLQATSSSGLSSHISNTNNPHNVTKAQIGLGNIPNAISDNTNSNSSSTLATSKAVYTVQQNVDQVVTATTNLTTEVAGLKASVATLETSSSGDFSSHIANKNNPHEVTKAQVGLSNIPNLVSDSVTANNSNALATAKAVYTVQQNLNTAITNANQTASDLATLTTTVSALQASTGANLSTHATDYNNPHKVTLAQLGLDKLSNLISKDPATSPDDNDAGKLATATAVYTSNQTAKQALATAQSAEAKADTNASNIDSLTNTVMTFNTQTLNTFSNLPSSYLTLNTEQTINGSKTFTKAITVKYSGANTTALKFVDPDQTKPNAPSASQIREIGFTDNANSFLGTITNITGTDLNNTMVLRCWDPSVTTNTYQDLGITYNKSTNSWYGICPNPPADANSTHIVTAQWANNRYATIATDQTISGKKTFTGTATFQSGDGSIYLKVSGITFGTNPSSTIYTENRIVSNDGKSLNVFGGQTETDGTNKAFIKAHCFDSSNNIWSEVLAVCKKDGTRYASIIPATPSSSTGSEIACASFVISKVNETKHSKVSVNIGTSWSGSSVPYTQNITVTGVTANSTVFISLATNATQAQVEAYRALNWTDGGQAANQITLRAWGDKNTITIPIVVTIRN